MTSRLYPFAVEIAAPFGMFARLDCGSDPYSEIAPSCSAARGIIDSICWFPEVEITMVAVGLCRVPTHTNYTFNSGSTMFRKSQLINQDFAAQIRASILVKPRYVLLGVMAGPIAAFQNKAHSCQAQFRRRLQKGISYHTPVMGWKDFPLSHCDIPSSPIVAYNTKLSIVSKMVHRIEYPADSPPIYHTAVQHDQNVQIHNGVLQYGEIPARNIEGKLRFEDSELNRGLDDFLTNNRSWNGGQPSRQRRKLRRAQLKGCS